MITGFKLIAAAVTITMIACTHHVHALRGRLFVNSARCSTTNYQRPSPLQQHLKFTSSTPTSSSCRSRSFATDANSGAEMGASSASVVRSSFLKIIKERGFLHQCTNWTGLDDQLSSPSSSSSVAGDDTTSSQPKCAYIGFDATASSLHVGSLVQIMMLRHFQKCGHRPVILLGGGTTTIGDPSGKDTTRQMLDNDTIENNVQSISKIFKKFLTFGTGPTDAVVVNNKEWLSDIKYLDFLRKYGRYFTINRMLSFESVKQRLAREQPLTFLEFNYMVLQAYDFVELHKKHEVVLQLGGSDQWGNIVCGIELARKLKGNKELFGLTAPLVTTSSGAKMGKTAAGAVWLDPTLLSPLDYWQFWRNTADSDVVKFLCLFTELPMREIRSIESECTGAALNDAKILLADEATKLLHGEKCIVEIKATVHSLYGHNSTNSGNGSGSRGDIDVSLTGLKRVFLDFPLEDGECIPTTISVADLLVKAELAASKNAGRRLIKAGGVYVNDERVDDELANVSVENFVIVDRSGTTKDSTHSSSSNRDQHNTKFSNINSKLCLKLSAGKKRHVLVVLE